MTPQLSEAELKLFRQLIKRHVGISSSRLKKSSLQRKLATRLSHLGLETYLAYYNYLRHDREGGLELRRLINTITVDQTTFFRHAKQFELLTNVMLPEIANQKKTVKKLRIWSAGCATGEEAYSIAMVVNEMFGGDNTWDIRILASDIDTDSLKIAYKGRYPSNCVQQVPPEYVEKYLRMGRGKEAGFFSVSRELRRNILFRRLNFTNSEFPFRSLVDIVFCRNVMIYFDLELKKRLIDSFFRVLERDGFLCLGASESLLGIDERFTLVGHSTYQKAE